MSIDFIVDGVDISYSENSMGGVLALHDHFELRSFNISETGYKSHFVPSGEVVNAGGYLAYASQLITQLWQDSATQFTLF